MGKEGLRGADTQILGDVLDVGLSVRLGNSRGTGNPRGLEHGLNTGKGGGVHFAKTCSTRTLPAGYGFLSAR